ncbi:hypothetical protein BOTNAR_0427g00040 [Botryotinia narcissicola]|uniref:Cytochrome P450 n=1 Tax=Botryotinia narcissicola TaxID=278944 RepID=A0A4Z1HKI2_9HELO|nr:hypothetical protein BOTNAR_0427g00040 [Botryotinia narcissicola]
MALIDLELPNAPSLGLLGLLFLVGYVLYFTIYVFYTRFYHLRQFPGPSLGAYSRLWLLKAMRSEQSAEWFQEVNNKYGSIARIGPNLLVTSDPDTWRKVLGIRSNYERGSWFDCLRIDPHRANLITERDRSKHNALRYQMASGYDGKDIEGLEATIDNNMREWIAYIEHNSLSSPQAMKPFDIARSIQWLDFDLICQLCFGHKLGFIANHSDRYDFQKTLDERLPIVEQIGVLTEFGSILRFISRVPFLNQVLPSVKDKSGVGKILGLARTAIDARYMPDFVPRKDLLAAWLDRGMDRSQAETEMVIALFAGSDTTATAIRGILLYIITSPPVYTRLISEIRAAYKNQSQSELASYAIARNLPYLHACIKEGLRLFPPVTALRQRVTPPEGDILGGIHVPGGVDIGVNIRGLLRHEATFGTDADMFRPERWLETTQPQLRQMERVHELLFNMGTTRCLGINLAMMMVHKFFAEVFRRWDIVIVNPTRPWDSRCHGVFQQKDFFVRITSRSIHVDDKPA